MDLRTAELLLGLRSDISTILTQQQAMTAAFETFKTVFEYLLAEREMLKSRLDTALGNDAADAARIAAAEAALAEAGAKVSELQALADTDAAEDASLLELVQPIVDEIAAAQPEPTPEPEITPDPEV